MIDSAAIVRAFRKHLLKMDGAPKDTDVAWENVPFIPPNPQRLWVQENYLPGNEDKFATNMLQQVGMIQYNIMVPSGESTEDGRKMTRLIGDQFKAGTGLTEDTVTIVVESVQPLKGMDAVVGNQAWYQLPVRITFRAYAVNDTAY